MGLCTPLYGWRSGAYRNSYDLHRCSVLYMHQTPHDAANAPWRVLKPLKTVSWKFFTRKMDKSIHGKNITQKCSLNSLIKTLIYNAVWHSEKERVVIGSQVEGRKYLEEKTRIHSFAPTRFLDEFWLESIEWFIEDQAFSPTYDLAPPPPPPPRSWQWARPVTHR
jgi:hypothetical protein